MVSLIKSPRFLGIVAVAVLQSLVALGYVSSDLATGLINIWSVAISSVVAVGSLDRVGSQS